MAVGRGVVGDPGMARPRLSEADQHGSAGTVFQKRKPYLELSGTIAEEGTPG